MIYIYTHNLPIYIYMHIITKSVELLLTLVGDVFRENVLGKNTKILEFIIWKRKDFIRKATSEIIIKLS